MGVGKIERKKYMGKEMGREEMGGCFLTWGNKEYVKVGGEK